MPAAPAEPAAVVAGITHLDAQVGSIAFDHELLDALAQAAGDPDFGAVPGAYGDAALEVVDGHLAVGGQRPALVDGGGGEGRGRGHQGGQDDQTGNHETLLMHTYICAGQPVTARWVSESRRE